MTATGTTAQQAADALLFELFMTPEGRAQPYPLYARLREAAPVFRSGLGFVVATRYDDCQSVLRDPRFGKDDRRFAERTAGQFPGWEPHPELADAVPSMLFLNPPDHTRLRGLVTKAFTPRTVEALRPAVFAMVDAILDDVAEAGEADVMSALAFPLPVRVIGEMLGVPPEDRAQFQSLVRAITPTLEPSVTLAQVRAAEEAEVVMVRYFRALVAERRADPRADLLSALIAAEEEGDKLTEAELVATAILLFAAGFETTTNLIGNGLLALLRHPAEAARLRAEPGLARSAVEELLRYDSPVQIDGRMALTPLDVGGVTVAEGEQVVTLLGAANRDPARFSSPDRLDLGRAESPPLSFASGIHYCLGAALARMEGQVVFTSLLARFASVELAVDEPAWRPGLTLRGLEALPVRVRPA